MIAMNYDLHVINSVIFLFFGFIFIELGLMLKFEPENAGLLSIIAGTIIILVNVNYFYLLRNFNDKKNI